MTKMAGKIDHSSGATSSQTWTSHAKDKEGSYQRSWFSHELHDNHGQQQTLERPNQRDVTEASQGWQIPREVAYKSNLRRKVSEPVEIRNRFSALQHATYTNSKEMKRNVVPGEYTYAQAIDKSRRPANQQESFKQSQEQQNFATLKRTGEPQTRFQTHGESTHNKFEQTRSFKPSVAILGDSMLRGVRKQEINRAAPQVKSYVKSFGGSTVEHMYSYMQPTISFNPDGIVFMCGTNNLRNESPEETANKIINLALTAKKSIKNVAVSSILMRRDSVMLDQKRVLVNIQLQRELPDFGINYINQDNIQGHHLDNWGLHLNSYGTKALTGNLVDFLHKV